ncbi:histone-lysine N-methyltransferase SETMAR [Trichonephila clavipes]|nr:histone-lysine N-methyltransferase SETMAR [Trichonephila clavipes]
MIISLSPEYVAKAFMKLLEDKINGSTFNNYYIGENASQAVKIVNDVYGVDTVTANYAQFWFRQFRSGIFDVKVASPVIKNVDKITEIIEVDRHVSSRSIAQELKIDHETVLSHLSNVGFKKKPDVCVPPQLTQKTYDGSNFHLRSSSQRMKSTFLKWMVTGDEK